MMLLLLLLELFKILSTIRFECHNSTIKWILFVIGSGPPKNFLVWLICFECMYVRVLVFFVLVRFLLPPFLDSLDNSALKLIFHFLAIHYGVVLLNVRHSSFVRLLSHTLYPRSLFLTCAILHLLSFLNLSLSLFVLNLSVFVCMCLPVCMFWI